MMVNQSAADHVIGWDFTQKTLTGEIPMPARLKLRVIVTL